ncbi:sulfate adenylyltransferase subunit 1 [Leadbettera azotonutricia]|uniref:Sulfate adenylyltransferase subunit 1 n=1 Tax=Leadbettera azotonutricia (strain ATCC BAA-888 / DSM 13862 / ZAS-9) TaxID=545695 RepID=F5YCM2_LEAAZ|nr:GTP-binding protein [Leadbettera azotonutricia]AEF80422.1 sulfate adenylyltransferase subunit 1 [Leadbettera azotonutricia ZAS-9]
MDDLHERMNIVITGHVDHGKSTLVGRLLADTLTLPEGKLQAVKDSCKKNGRVFEYAFLLDALEDEQKQGITIDSARIFFKSKKREYIIIDAPGHIEFLRNMLSGASRAEAAVLVIDAVEGVAENSKRHGLLLSLLGISQVLVAVNKLDAVNYDEQVFERIKNEYTAYLETLKVKPLAFVPVSAREGKNITEPASEMPWYTGSTVLEILDSFKRLSTNENSFFAMPVQDVYRFSNDNDDRRIYAGTVVSGEIFVGDSVTFLPSKKTAHVKNIEVWNAPPRSSISTGEAAGLTLEEEIYIKSGEVMVKSLEKSLVETSTRVRANVIWLGMRPLGFNKTYLLKLGCARVEARLEKIESFLGDDREEYDELRRHECGSVILGFARPTAISSFYDNADLGRFVLVDGYDASGGGIILENLSAKKSWESLNSFEGLAGKDNFEEELFALLKKYFPQRFE